MSDAPTPPAADPAAPPQPPSESLLGAATIDKTAPPPAQDPAAAPSAADAWALTPEIFGDRAKEIDPTRLEGFGKIAADLKLSPDQAKGLAKWYGETMPTGESAAATEERLKQEWGGEYRANLALANRAATKIGMLKEIDAEGLGDNRTVLKVLAKLGAMIGEGGPTDRPKDGGGAMTPDQAKAEIARLRKDKGFQSSYADARDPDHKAAVEKMVELMKLAKPE